MSESSAVTVRYWAGAREAAGCVEEHVEPGPVAALLDLLTARHGIRLERVLAASVVLVDGTAIDRAGGAAVPAGALLEVLPPFAGG